MAKDLTTRIYHGKFGLFNVTLTTHDTHTLIASERVVGTEKSVRDYIRNYLIPQHREPGKKIEVSCEELETPKIDYIAVPKDTQAT